MIYIGGLVLVWQTGPVTITDRKSTVLKVWRIIKIECVNDAKCANPPSLVSLVEGSHCA